MRKITQSCSLLLIILFFAGHSVSAQAKAAVTKDPVLKTWLIERDIPGAGKLSADQLKGISQKSCTVLTELGPGIQWLQSYVAGNKIYCIYKAENEELLREHGKKGGFPVTAITEIASTISPETAK